MAKNHFVSHFLPFQINTTIFIFGKFLYKMAAASHFGCPKITFGRISGHWINAKLFLIFFWQNGRWRPIWMSEIHFRSHFWPFQIDKQLFFFTKWLTSAILDVRNSLLIAYQAISDRYATIRRHLSCVIGKQSWLNRAHPLAIGYERV